MSLLSERMRPVSIMTFQCVDDGEGGTDTAMSVEREVQAAIVIEQNAVVNIADHKELSRSYTIITPKGTGLEFHRVIRDEKGRCFRVTSDAADRYTPGGASFQVEAVSAEAIEAVPEKDSEEGEVK